MGKVAIILVAATAVVALEVLNMQHKIEIVDYLSRDYFGSRAVLFLKLAPQGNEAIKAASSVGLTSVIVDLNSFLAIANTDFYPVPIVVASLSQEQISGFSKVTNQLKMSNMHWIIFFQVGLENNFQNFHIPYDCKFVVVTSTAGKISFTELYKVAKGKALQANALGPYNPSTRSGLPNSGFFFRRLNLMGIELNYLTHILDPCADNSFAAGHVVLCIHEMVWQLTAQVLNITTKPIFFERQGFAMIPILRQPDVDVAITGIYLSSPTVAALGFFWPIFKTELEVFSRYGGIGISWNRYLRPFTTNIWVAVLVWISSCSFVFYVTHKLGYFVLKIKQGCRPEQYWTPIFAFLSQGSSEPAFSTWERLLLLSAFIGPAVLIPAYSASLTSFLATQTPDAPFTDLSQMKNHPQYRLSGTRDYNMRALLQGDDDTTKYLLNHGILPTEKQPANDLEGVKRMCKEPLAFITTAYAMEALKPACKFYALPKKFLIFHQSMTFTKNSSYKVPYNIIMRNLRFSGVLQTLKNTVILKQLFAMFLEKETVKELPPVNFENILVLIFFLIIATCTSFSILFIEVAFTKKSNKTKKIAVIARRPRTKMHPFYM